MVNPHFMWKAGQSGSGDCPALYRVDGGHVLVGKILSSDDLAAVRSIGEAHDSGVAADETAVFIPTDILDRYASERANGTI